MAESAQSSAFQTTDHKRRKVEAEGGHVKVERVKGVVADKAKANYLSGQLRLRLQYAKLKVEHGWQRQTLSEVENLYFRHTHLTRPYPVISPGGRRNGRMLSSASFSTTIWQQENVPSISNSQTTLQLTAFGSAGPTTGLRTNGTLTGTSSSISVDSSVTLSLPSTPTPNINRVATPLAPHVGFGNAPTRYPISRSDSTATVIMESAPSLYHPHNSTPNAKANQPSASSHSSTHAPPPPSSSQTYNSFHEPFDPMQPTGLVDSQLAALRSIMSTSIPIPLPPPSSATPTASPVPSTAAPGAGATSPGIGGGLTYDAFWSTHGSSTTSYRSVLSGRSTSAAPLQAHASAPAMMAASAGNGASGGGLATPR